MYMFEITNDSTFAGNSLALFMYTYNALYIFLLYICSLFVVNSHIHTHKLIRKQTYTFSLALLITFSLLAITFEHYQQQIQKHLPMRSRVHVKCIYHAIIIHTFQVCAYAFLCFCSCCYYCCCRFSMS